MDREDLLLPDLNDGKSERGPPSGLSPFNLQVNFSLRSMPSYSVLLPFTGSVSIEVEASSVEEAIHEAFQVEFGIKVETPLENKNNVFIEEFETQEQIVKGNVFYGGLNEPEAMLLEEEEEEEE